MAERKSVDTPETLDTTEARQATPQKLNYRVLTRSLLIAVIAAAVVYAYFYFQSPG